MFNYTLYIMAQNYKNVNRCMNKMGKKLKKNQRSLILYK